MDTTLPVMFFSRAESNPDIVAQMSRDKGGPFVPYTYRTLANDVKSFSGVLAGLGVGRGDRVGLISDNRREWLIADLSVLTLGAVDVPRGCDTTGTELAYILSFSECRFTFAENSRQLDKFVDAVASLPELRTVIMFEEPSEKDRERASGAGFRLEWFGELMKNPGLYSKPGFDFDSEIAAGKPDDLATIIFTSGTTGEPKGVMLSHGNFLAQLRVMPEMLGVEKGTLWLSVLPVWHVFERVLQYAALVTVTGIAYSKPIGSIMLPDFEAVKPQWFGSVPRIWESVMEGVYRSVKKQGPVKVALFSFFLDVGIVFRHEYNKLRGFLPEFRMRIRALDIVASLPLLLVLAPLYALGSVLVFKNIKKKLGGKFIAGISGGGALPENLDTFFSGVGIKVLEGYGLTESAPVIAVRRRDRPVPYTVGQVLSCCEVRIKGDNGEDLPYGKPGVIHVKGGQVMSGYLKKPELTEKVLKDGWLDTGDIGMLTRKGELKITGRAKDTIVLRGGENVEPAPMEAKLCESPYIRRAVMIGQDQRYLGALIVPDRDSVMQWSEENRVPILDWEDLLKQPEVLELFNSEVNSLLSARNGFRSFERVFRFALLPDDFQIGKELSHKQEVMRHAIVKIYRDQVEAIFHD